MISLRRALVRPQRLRANHAFGPRHIVPWTAVLPGDVTVLTTSDGRPLTKTITTDGLIPYSKAFFFKAEAFRLGHFEDLAELLWQLATASASCIIRGVLLPELMGRQHVLRRTRTKPDSPPTFREIARCWIMIDLDGVRAPCGVDATDPVAVGGWLRRTLPVPFRCARCFVQLSSSAGQDPRVLKAHLWFWLSRPLDRRQAEDLLGAVPGIDVSVFRTIQPNYCASPILAGGEDPCLERAAVLSGYAAVDLDALPTAGTYKAARAGARAAGRNPQGKGYGPGAGNGHAPPAGAPYAERVYLAGLGHVRNHVAFHLNRLARAGEGARHRTCVSVSAHLIGLAKAGVVDLPSVVGAVKGIMAGKGFDGRGDRDLTEIDALLTWVWETVPPAEIIHG